MFSNLFRTHSSFSYKRTIFLLLIINLIIPSLADLSDYYVFGSGGYSHLDATSAGEACVAESKQLCSPEQLFRVVYEDVEGDSNPSLCLAGFTSGEGGDYAWGWFNADSGSTGCTDQWNPTWSTTFGAHCCSDFAGQSFESCSSHSCSDGWVPSSDYSHTFCATCDDSACCIEQPDAPNYHRIRPSPLFTSLDDASIACTDFHPDMTSCTGEQLEGLSKFGELICSSGWFNDGSDDATIGWFVNEGGDCNNNPLEVGWQSWADNVDGAPAGVAHCCTASYSTSGNDALAPSTVDTAAAHCASNKYQTELCTSAQLRTISFTEDTDLCNSGWTADAGVGWWQNDVPGSCGVGSAGWQTWAHSSPSAHCCAEYVMEYIVELGNYGAVPASYAESTITDGASAETACTDYGYDGLCTQEQVAWLGTNEQTSMCSVGYASNGAGGFVTPGFYNSAPGLSGCGDSESWNDAWQPTNPVAHCCQSDVPSMTLATPPYYNGDWDYSYATMEDAAAKCTGDYSLCTQAQVYTIAAIGVDWDQGTQQETSLCRIGWTSDAGAGWYQVDEASGCMAANAWNTFTSGAYGYHCCTNFIATPMVSKDAAFTLAGAGYSLSDASAALAACQGLNSEYSLCSDAQVVEGLMNGVTVADEDETWSSVDPNTNVCTTGWVGSSNCDNDVGFFQVDAGCGVGAMTWSGWWNEVGADAWCCSPLVVPASDYMDELGCTHEPTDSPTLAPATSEPTKTPSDAPFVSDPSQSPVAAMQPPSKSPVTYLCNNYYVNVGSVVTPPGGDDDWARLISGIYMGADDWYGFFYQPSSYDRDYGMQDRSLQFDGVDAWTWTDPTGPTEMTAVASTQDALDNGITLSDGTNIVSASLSCTNVPDQQALRDVDATAIASLGLVRVAADSPSDALLNFVTLLASSHTKASCRVLFGSLLDSNSLSSERMEDFKNGVFTSGADCVPAGYSPFDALEATDALWGRCAGSNLWSHRGAICGVWNLIFGVTANRADSGSVTGASGIVSTVNAFMGMYIDQYITSDYGAQLQFMFNFAPGLSARRNLQFDFSATTDDIYYLQLYNAFLNEVELQASVDGQPSPDPYNPPVEFPPSDLCTSCADDNEVLQTYLQAFFTNDDTDDDDAATNMATFSVCEEEASCVYIVVYQTNACCSNLEHAGLYTRLEDLNNFKYQYSNNENGNVLHYNDEIWDIDDGDDTYRFSSLSAGDGDECSDLLPPSLDTWSLVKTGESSALIQYTNVAAACDAGDRYTVGGGVIGLTHPGESVTVTSAGESITLTNSGEFSFAYQWYNFAYYDVTFEFSAGITCTYSNSQGQIAGADISSIVIECEEVYFTVGGSISGVSDEYPVVLDISYSDESGSGSTSLSLSANGDFSFGGVSLLNGGTYTASLSDSNPEYYECTIANAASGTVAGENVEEIVVSCVMRTYSIGGSVSLPHYGSVELELYQVIDGEIQLPAFGQALLEDYRGLGGADWKFYKEMPRGWNWEVRVIAIDGYDSCTASHSDSTQWSEENLRWDIDWVDIECQEASTLCQIPDWSQSLVDDGLPTSLVGQIKVCGSGSRAQYYFNSEATCVGGSDDLTAVCDGEQLVCPGLLNTQYGSYRRQVESLLQALGVDETCVNTGDTCDVGATCCNPYDSCYWQVDIVSGFTRKCAPHSDCNANFGDDCLSDPTDFTSPACPPADDCVYTQGYALDPFTEEILYCVTSEGVYYMNGMNTCQTDTEALSDTYFYDFEFGTDECDAESMRSFDAMLDDNIYVVGGTADHYLETVNNAIDNCCIELEDYSDLVSGWSDDLAYIETQITSYDSDLQVQLDAIVAQAKGILDYLMTEKPSST